MPLLEKLAHIQNELKAPKGQMNKFGNYKYRSAEDILEAVKPIAFKYESVIRLYDDLVLVGDRYYIKATAIITHFADQENAVEVSSFAREEESKKGMDGSQVTGASSSYARKYALNGLLLIDDTKDSDATNDGKGTPAKTDPAKPVEDDGKVYKCDNPECGKVITRQISEFSTKVYKRPFCLECQGKIKANQAKKKEEELNNKENDIPDEAIDGLFPEGQEGA
ncbi:MAG: ERF family protein [Proteobacteria bacterium]|nr:ERF family protein [Pseudomonadota bacterium]